MAAFGIILNIIALIQSRKKGISIVGPILGIIGNALFLISAVIAFPAIVVIIIGTVFIFLHQPARSIN
jgi:hypothetical protein